jgi:PAS domain S-box-containing protein
MSLFAWAEKKKSSVLILVALMLFVGRVEHSATGQTLSITVGVYENNPMIYTSEGEVKGVYADILNYIAEKEDWAITWEVDTWNNNLARLENASIDIMTAIAYSSERALLYDFNNETVLANYGKIYQQTSTNFESFIDLEGKTIAVLVNDIFYEGEYGIKNLLEQFDLEVTYLVVNAYSEVLEAVEEGRADAGVVNRLYTDDTRNYNVKESPLIFSPIEPRFAFPKGETQNSYLIERIDYHLKDMKTDDDSIYYESIEEHVGGVETKTETEIPLWVFGIIYLIGGLLLLFFGGIVVLRYQVRRKTQELRESEEEIKTILESSPYGIVVTNLEGKIVKCNQQALIMQKINSKDELYGKDAFEVFSPKELERAKEVIRQTLNGKMIKNQLFQLKRKDGSTYPGEVSTNLVLNAKGKPRFVVSITQNVTERMKLEEGQEKAKKEAEFYSDILTHDVANLSQIIEGYLFLMEEEMEDKIEMKYFEGINKTVKRTSELVMNIKLVKAIETSETRKYNLRQAIDQSIAKILENYSKEIIIENNIEKECYISANKYLENAFENILKNAIEYSEEPVMIKISSKPEKGYSKITLEDQGKGISKVKIVKIMNYSDIHSIRIGLGLFFVKIIVEKFNGKFEIEQGREKGTKIILKIPLWRKEK